MSVIRRFGTSNGGRDDFEPPRHPPFGKINQLGLICTRVPTIEAQDAQIGVIEKAAGSAPFDRLGICPQGGFSSTLWTEESKVPGTGDGQWAGLRTMLNVARED